MAKKRARVDVAAALQEQTNAFQRARREGFNLAQLRQLQALGAYLEELGNSECKTIGNGHPPGLHCLACTWNHIRRDVQLAIEFWSDPELRNGALS